MKTLKMISLVCVLTSTKILAQPVASPTDVRMQQLETIVKQIERDQLNYKIEKDLLRETYSTQYQTIQLVLSIILGIFTVLGYLGYRSVDRLKKEYSDGLARLNLSRDASEKQLSNLAEALARADRKLGELQSVNTDQSRRIELLELKDNIATRIRDGQFYRAVEYADLALEIEPEDVEILSLKATGLSRLGRYPEVIPIFAAMLDRDPNLAVAAHNLAEYYLILGQHEEYDQLKNDRAPAHFPPDKPLSLYFEILSAFLRNDPTAFKTHLMRLVDLHGDASQRNLVTGWNFWELGSLLRNHTNSSMHACMSLLLSFLQGNASAEALRTSVESVPNIA